MSRPNFRSNYTSKPEPKTRACRFTKENCKYRDCTHAHDENEIRIRTCPYNLNCKKRSTCLYKHDDKRSESRNSDRSDDKNKKSDDEDGNETEAELKDVDEKDRQKKLWERAINYVKGTECFYGKKCRDIVPQSDESICLHKHETEEG